MTRSHAILGNKSDAPEKSMAMLEQMRLAALNSQFLILLPVFMVQAPGLTQG